MPVFATGATGYLASYQMIFNPLEWALGQPPKEDINHDWVGSSHNKKYRWWLKMRWAMTGLAVFAVAQTGMACASSQDSDIWVGLDDNRSGFLLDEDTGRVWMTGPCLKKLEPAIKSGTVWTSHTVELVSVGRGLATLDQRFELDIRDTGASITVVSNGRGGVQRFDALIDRECRAGGICAELIATQTVCSD